MGPLDGGALSLRGACTLARGLAAAPTPSPVITDCRRAIAAYCYVAREREGEGESVTYGLGRPADSGFVPARMTPGRRMLMDG